MFCCNRLLRRLPYQKTCFYCRFVVFCRKLFVFRNFYAPLHTIFLFCRFLSCFSNAFSSVLFLYLFMNNSLLLFFRVLQNVFACIFSCCNFVFIIVISALLLILFITGKFCKRFFQTHLHENAFFYFLSIIINVFFAIFYFCCDFVFIIVNADVTFFLFLSKGLFKRFFLSQTLVFCCVYQNVFACIFFLVATLFFILVLSALLFPFVTERFLADFSTAFSPKTAYFLPFCGISLAVHVHCKKIPLVVLGNCRFILQIFL